MPRQSVKQLTVNQNVRCESIYPDPDEPHTDCPAGHSARWKGDTIAFHLTRQQAIDLAKVLLVGSQEWDSMTVTAFRTHKRKSDGTYPVTVSALNRRVRRGSPRSSPN
jgi:hypothetical protein